MWRILPGTVLSLLPRRWRASPQLEQAFPWVLSVILCGALETLLAFVGEVYWYSYSVATWTSEALDSALRNGPQAAYDPHALGLAAFVVWFLHPYTVLIGTFFFEGMLRITAAVATEQVFGIWPLAIVDWVYGKATHRPPDAEGRHIPPFWQVMREIVAAVKQRIKIARLPEVADELFESHDDPEHVLEIHSSRPRPDWIPPRVVRIANEYYSLESTCERQPPRPFVFRLRRLATGVPGRSVLVYESPRSGKTD